MYLLWSRGSGLSKQNLKIIVFQIICFSTDYGIEGPLITYMDIIYGFRLHTSENKLWCIHIWVLFTQFAQKWKISTIYHQYSESFIEIIPLPVSHAMNENALK